MAAKDPHGRMDVLRSFADVPNAGQDPPARCDIDPKEIIR
jgi:hypothetical protein